MESSRENEKAVSSFVATESTRKLGTGERADVLETFRVRIVLAFLKATKRGPFERVALSQDISGSEVVERQCNCHEIRVCCGERHSRCRKMSKKITIVYICTIKVRQRKTLSVFSGFWAVLSKKYGMPQTFR